MVARDANLGIHEVRDIVGFDWLARLAAARHDG
jgi:hypothetical protein